jgi:hypothetical protein
MNREGTPFRFGGCGDQRNMTPDANWGGYIIEPGASAERAGRIPCNVLTVRPTGPTPLAWGRCPGRGMRRLCDHRTYPVACLMIRWTSALWTPPNRNPRSCSDNPFLVPASPPLASSPRDLVQVAMTRVSGWPLIRGTHAGGSPAGYASHRPLISSHRLRQVILHRKSQLRPNLFPVPPSSPPTSPSSRPYLHPHHRAQLHCPWSTLGPGAPLGKPCPNDSAMPASQWCELYTTRMVQLFPPLHPMPLSIGGIAPTAIGLPHSDGAGLAVRQAHFPVKCRQWRR